MKTHLISTDHGEAMVADCGRVIKAMNYECFVDVFKKSINRCKDCEIKAGINEEMRDVEKMSETLPMYPKVDVDVYKFENNKDDWSHYGFSIGSTIRVKAYNGKWYKTKFLRTREGHGYYKIQEMLDDFSKDFSYTYNLVIKYAESTLILNLDQDLIDKTSKDDLWLDDNQKD